MDEIITLSALGRSFTVGDLYDYPSDQIKNLELEQLSTTEIRNQNLVFGNWDDDSNKFSIILQPTRAMKLAHLKVNAHLEASIVSELIPPNEVWCYKYLEEDTCSSNTASVSVHLKITAGKDSLKIGQKTYANTQKLKAATHFVTDVSYGLEAIFVLEVVCQNQTEKISCENQLFFGLKRAFSNNNQESVEQLHKTNAKSCILDSALCTVYSNSKEIRQKKPTMNFAERFKLLTDLVERGGAEILLPLEVSLLPLDSDITIRDLDPDLMTRLSLVKNSLHQVSTKLLDDTIKDPFLSTVPHLRSRLVGFGSCYEKLQTRLTEALKNNTITYRKTGSKKEIDQLLQMTWTNYFNSPILLEWIMERQREMSLLKDMLTNILIPWKPEKMNFKPDPSIQTFPFKTIKVEDPIISKLHEDLRIQPSQKLWTTFELFSFNLEDQKTLRKELKRFSKEFRCKDCAFLVTSSENGTVNYSIRPCDLTETSNIPHELYNQSKSSSQSSLKFLEDIHTDKPVQNGKLYQDTSETNQSLQSNEKTVSPMLTSALSSQSGSVAHGSVKLVKHNRSASVFETFETDDQKIKTELKGSYDGIYLGKSFDRVAVQFVNKSQQLKEGEPSVYLLKSDERISLNGELRWFDIGKQTQGAKIDHKVIILMGATGSGKSTLIDGMVNYILGVEWNDNFRFRIVHDGATDQGRSQVHSQTSSVTAYTIHHVEGMRTPYGITIIDTPGFGDTGGVQRDEEITRIITRFLCHPETNQHLNFINAVCFVASSVDSRLTPTQQYILNSVSSIFGKDMKDHLQLLVTFSDEMTPPVLEAIRKAGISGLSDADPVRHHKFNNAALFAGNTSDPDGASINEFYWKLGKKNFKSFFEKLAESLDQSLQQTQLNVKARVDREEYMQRFNIHLSVIYEKLVTVENVQRKLTSLDIQLNACKNYTEEIVRPVLKTIRLPKGYLAWNCHKCSQTCNQNTRGANNTNKCPLCSCFINEHKYDEFECVWEQVTEYQTNESLKAQYESVSIQISTVNEELVKSQQELTEAKQGGVALLNRIHSIIKILEKSSLQSSKIMSLPDYIESIKRQTIQEGRPSHLTLIQTLDEMMNMINE